MWRCIIRDLAARGDGERESGAFLLGHKNGQRREALDYVLYDDLEPGCLDGGFVQMSSIGFRRLGAEARNRLLRLRAEMKLPGKAWLQFDSQPQAGKTLFTVTAYFAPHGLFGFLYWYAMWPFHKFIFDGLTRRLASRARVLAH